MRGTWQTTDGGGSGIGTAILAVLAAAVVVKAAPAVLGAAAELLHAALIVVFMIAGTGAVGMVALLALKYRRARAAAAARTMPPLLSKVVRAAPPLSQERRAGELPAAPQGEPPGGLHFHGIPAEDIAAILARQTLPGPDANPPGPPRVP